MTDPMPDAQDTAEALDDDKLGGDYPPDTFLGATDANDDAIPETFEERTQRLVPEDDREVPRRAADGQAPALSEEDLVDDVTGAEDAAMHEEPLR